MKLEECRGCSCYQGEIDAVTIECTFWNKTDLRLIVRNGPSDPRVVICPRLKEQKEHCTPPDLYFTEPAPARDPRETGPVPAQR